MPSRLEKHLSEIQKLRASGLTWQAITAKMKAAGVSTSPPALYQFMERKRKRAVKILRQLGPLDELARMARGDESRGGGVLVESPQQSAKNGRRSKDQAEESWTPKVIQPKVQTNKPKPKAAKKSDEFVIGDDILK